MCVGGRGGSGTSGVWASDGCLMAPPAHSHLSDLGPAGGGKGCRRLLVSRQQDEERPHVPAVAGYHGGRREGGGVTSCCLVKRGRQHFLDVSLSRVMTNSRDGRRPESHAASRPRAVDSCSPSGPVVIRVN